MTHFRVALLALATLMVAVSAWAQAAAPAAATDWSGLVTPVIVAVIPLLVILAKKVIPDKYAAFYPLIATALGPVLEWGSTYVTQQAASPGRGLLMGMAAVALREIVDQIKKLPAKAEG